MDHFIRLEYGDDYYLICDPTYIGATIGRCMPRFRSVQPAVKMMHSVLASDGKTTPLEPRLDKKLILADVTVESIAPLQQ